jgi:hypothetical protein
LAEFDFVLANESDNRIKRGSIEFADGGTMSFVALAPRYGKGYTYFDNVPPPAGPVVIEWVTEDGRTHRQDAQYDPPRDLYEIRVTFQESGDVELRATSEPRRE